jgi:hypothetical protein
VVRLANISRRARRIIPLGGDGGGAKHPHDTSSITAPELRRALLRGLPSQQWVSLMTTKVRAGHAARWKAQRDFDLGASIEFVADDNPWQLDTDGHRFGDVMLSVRPARVAGVIELSRIAFHPPLKYPVQGHLRWWYTLGEFIKIDGRFYFE